MRALILGLCLLVAACSRSEPSGTTSPPPAASNPAFPREKLAAFSPLPTLFASTKNPITDAKVELGRALYFDPRLSKSQRLSCNSCHDLATYGVDGERFSTGHGGQKGGRNAPTVYNAAGHVAQFWDGREPDVEAQAKGPMLNPVEMAMPDGAAVVAVLRSIPGYVPLFASAFPEAKDPVTLENATAAIGAFERRLVTPSRFDRFLAGDDAALTDAEKRGLVTFVDTGCPTCHSGPLVGGALFMKLGLVNAWPGLVDPGRFAVTKAEADRGVFKVPSLRNVTKTGPYFHDGEVEALPEAVRRMAHYQLGKDLTDADVARIVDFLGALTGDVPSQLIEPPKLPPSGPRTPQPSTG